MVGRAFIGTSYRVPCPLYIKHLNSQIRRHISSLVLALTSSSNPTEALGPLFRLRSDAWAVAFRSFRTRPQTTTRYSDNGVLFVCHCAICYTLRKIPPARARWSLEPQPKTQTPTKARVGAARLVNVLIVTRQPGFCR